MTQITDEQFDAAVRGLHEALGGDGWAYTNYGKDELRSHRAELEAGVRVVANALSTPPVWAETGGPPSFEFDRYVNGRLMAEGVTVERQPTLEKAMQVAARIAAKGPNGEPPVLVFRTSGAETGEPVAWRYCTTDINGNEWPWDYSENAITIEDRKERGFIVQPLFAAPPRSDKANGERAAALEEAAGVADAHAKAWGLAMGTGATEIAKAIRALSASPEVPNTVGEDKQADLVDRLKLEAQIHAGEARAANSTINEIYQIISGGTGEPGNWNGAEPVRAYVASSQALREALEALPDRADQPNAEAFAEAVDDWRKETVMPALSLGAKQ